ncbi:MAG TPA: hypothetical protein ENG95_02175 [Nitrospirae bacterium]|nr:dihydrolipoamide dehydrogenase [bacterium BMS3Bbin08]HDH00461.1 hypothetical protein [Nitrospirota bacterium]HDH04283.1 hypothetical protein [Nitrospirota bacterium]HDO25438.1 hypothetical protein [Nitrospirota bacterium]
MCFPAHPLTQIFNRYLRVICNIKLNIKPWISRQAAALSIDIKGKGEQQIRAERLLVAAGLRANTGDLDIDNSGVELDEKGFNELPRSKLRGIKSVIPACPESSCIKDRFRTSRNDKNDENY